MGAMKDNDSGLPGIERFSLGVLLGNVAVDPAVPAQVSIQNMRVLRVIQTA